MRRTLLAFLLATAVTSASANDQIAITTYETRNGSLIPGDSPIRYCSNPTNDTFKIESIDMYPNPCVIESYCGVKIWGTFTSNLTNPHISFMITTHFDDGRQGQMPGEDDFCKWLDVVQNDTSQCPPREGKATLSSTALLLGGWVPEANYTVDVRVTSDQGPVFHICADFEMKPKYEDGVELR
ncbi:hypothetical protein JMJ35_005324 [Cladonia borealis]|uniref:Phosphatidylglycerol/phosphatidylinositol transfer protein n=1 Tax=Cladonia borealis TaxID=184061 RepID=A0AA39R2F7_9LECA|nr:hypothetical protein JMJ35_005324 [Cladonia borealis]